jgi:hypothetical protein
MRSESAVTYAGLEFQSLGCELYYQLIFKLDTEISIERKNILAINIAFCIHVRSIEMSIGRTNSTPGMHLENITFQGNMNLSLQYVSALN